MSIDINTTAVGWSLLVGICTVEGVVFRQLVQLMFKVVQTAGDVEKKAMDAAARIKSSEAKKMRIIKDALGQNKQDHRFYRYCFVTASVLSAVLLIGVLLALLVRAFRATP